MMESEVVAVDKSRPPCTSPGTPEGNTSIYSFFGPNRNRNSNK